jgi:hypothetical protein
MTDDQLRALVRDAVARHLGQGAASHAAYAPDAAAVSVVVRQHPSHYRYGLPSGDDADGPCLIEPAVRCNHCGYCQSHGH